MFLRQRPARVSELDRLLIIARDIAYYTDQDKRDMVRMWTEWIRERIMLSVVFEDLDVPQNSELRFPFFCVSAFLDDEFAAKARSSLPPPLTLNVLNRWREGRPATLTERQIVERNHPGGKPMVLGTTHSGMPLTYLTEKAGQLARDQIVHWIPASAEGYRLEEWWLESYTEWERAWSRAAGLTFGSTYKSHYDSLPQPPPPEQQATLGSVKASEVAASLKDGSSFASMFYYQRPRISFSTGEKDLLMLALYDLDDSEIAAELCISAHTVKKRWALVFDRVAAAVPDLLPASSDATGPHRGPEKRRNLLMYLQHHREEIRPHAIIPPRT